MRRSDGMPPLLADGCEVNEGLKARFSKCKGAPIGLCVYCGRTFCADHGEVRDHGEEICSRKNCVAKRDDLRVHLQYKDFVVSRNGGGKCGLPDCDQLPEGQCARCRAYFCYRHLETHEEITGSGLEQVSRMATLCSHCWERRPIWTRV